MPGRQLLALETPGGDAPGDHTAVSLPCRIALQWLSAVCWHQVDALDFGLAG